MNRSLNFKTRKMVLLAILTAIIVLLQTPAVAAKMFFPMFTLTLVLVPVVIGAALCGAYAGAWLGFVFGIAVLISGDAAPFLVINPGGAVLVVLAKGICAGLAAGVVYKFVEKENKTAAAILAAIVCPLVNTGFFVLGSYVFFLPTISAWGEAAGFANATHFLFFGMIGINFVVELGINLVLCPVIVRLVQYGQQMWGSR